jgi:hypothetical protein
MSTPESIKNTLNSLINIHNSGKLISFLFIILLIYPIAFTSETNEFISRKPLAVINGIKKGKMDKLAFFGIQRIELTGKNTNNFEIVKYEFDFSCEGKISLKAYKGNGIDKEIISLVKSCKRDCIADFTNIIARNKVTGKEVLLNEIRLMITN